MFTSCNSSEGEACGSLPDRRTGEYRLSFSMCFSLLQSFIAVILAITIGSTHVAFAEDLPSECSGKLIKDASHLKLDSAYQLRAGGYCDGAVPEAHVGRLQLVSLTYGPVQFSASDSLKITSFDDANIKLRGWDLRQNGNYRLDGAFQAGKAVINLSNAVRPLGLTAVDLGLYGWRDDSTNRVFSPVASGEIEPVQTF